MARFANRLLRLSGAARELAKLRQREETIIRQYPELRDVAGTPDAPAAARGRGKRRGRRKFTAAERKAASLRAKKMWAERKQKQA
jgi:hypothetical protein